MSTPSPTPATEPDDLVRQKVEQLPAVLREKGIDVWMIFARETELLHDPSLDTVVGANVTWQSAFLFGAGGERIAIVGSLDVARIERTGLFPRVIGYVKSIRDDLRRELGALDPQVLALNYSTDSELADGLTHGMYLLLGELLESTPYLGHAVSSHAVLAALRGRKSAGELGRIRQACALTQQIFDAVTPRLAAGLTERDVAALIRGEMGARGLGPAWEPEQCPAVFTGPGSAGAHAGPTDTRIEPGHVLNVDFGVRFRGYCSDMQRTWYFLRPDEKAAPEAVARGFATIRDAIREAAAALRPGRLGHEIDAVARGLITAGGYPEYDHALGHQVGRTAHDGAALLGPRWERYARRVEEPIEAGQVFTLEPRLPIQGHGIATMEEIVAVTATGCEWLTEPQTELYLVPHCR
ncbi:MAG: aminopeptidase P family protein [Deltaproteobacteria bacterium]|nr:aminopeptidase P family protein [Deltaproteobacteria bacterium]